MEMLFKYISTPLPNFYSAISIHGGGEKSDFDVVKQSTTYYLGLAEKVKILQFEDCHWSEKSFKKQAIVNEESKVRLSPLQNIKNKLKIIKAIEKAF